MRGPSRVIQGRTQRALPSRPPKPDPVAAAAKEAAAAGPAVELSAEQERVRELVVNDGVSLFFTGSAGPSLSLSPALPRKAGADR